MFKTTRRGFLVGCSTSIAAMAGSRFNHIAFGNPENEPTQEIVLTIFLRGGCDALSLITPFGNSDDRGHYEQARSDLRIPSASLYQLGNTMLGLHPAAVQLHELFTNNNLAVIPATGMHSDTRSHFDAMAYMELGTPDQKSITSGWITRHLQTLDGGMDGLMTSLSVGNLIPTSLSGTYDTYSMDNPTDYNLNTGYWRWRPAQRTALRNMYTAQNTAVHQAGVNAINAADIMETNNVDDYVPAAGADYPNDSFGRNLQTVAQMIKLQLGLRAATVDYGGWDTHENQVGGDPAGGYFGDKISTLSQGLHAFYTDLNGSDSDTYTDRLTVVVMSEFGRRLKENADRGTDHGHGGFMMVLGGNVKGGLHGTWPGLSNAQLYDNEDLEVTTDYRRVLSEILIRRFANPNLGYIFPGYTGYQPLDFMEGTDLTPIYDGADPTPTPSPTPGTDPTPTPTPTQMPNNDAHRLYTPFVSRP